MTKKRTAPTTQKETAGARSSVQYKGSEFILSTLQNAFFITLSNGQQHSSHQLMQQLHTSDPRKEIQYLRRKGINVQDVWVEAAGNIPRHKLYFIDPKEYGKGASNE